MIQRQKLEFSHSKFYMWRCITAMAHADGIVHEEERIYLTNIFNNMHQKTEMSDDQYATLIDDLLKNPQEMSSLFSHINDPIYRSQIIYFARILAYKDGELHPNEEAVLSKLHLAITEGLDMETIRKEVQENVSHEMVLHDTKIDRNRPNGLLSSMIDEVALKFGIDILKD